MFFRKLFAKDYRYYKEKGDRLFADERYADARASYSEALEKVGGDNAEENEVEYLHSKIGETGNLLAVLNISEAEHALLTGNSNKACESLELALELAEDVAVREKAANLMKDLDTPHFDPVPSNPAHGTHNCGDCSGHTSDDSNRLAPPAAGLHDDEEFTLLVQTLPDDLPVRYTTLGKKFACAYLKAHRDENLGSALREFEELLAEGESDILLYELAIINYRQGNRKDCERLLRKALALNERNALCHLSLVQLFMDDGRLADAVQALRHMHEHNLLGDQALIMLGDVYAMQGDEGKALDTFAIALEVPALKRAAAERLVPLLGNMGRTEEATYLIKNYLKGCC